MKHKTNIQNALLNAVTGKTLDNLVNGWEKQKQRNLSRLKWSGFFNMNSPI